MGGGTGSIDNGYKEIYNLISYKLGYLYDKVKETTRGLKNTLDKIVGEKKK